MIKSLILFLLVVCWSSAFGQTELKTNAFGPILQDRVDLLVEFKVSNRLTLQPGIGYSYAPEIRYTTNIVEFKRYKSGTLLPTFFTKFYPTIKEDNSGLNFGGYLEGEIIVYIDPQHKADHLAMFGTEEVYNDKIRKMAVGSYVAYKWIFGDHLVLQPLIGLDLDLYHLLFTERRSFDFASIAMCELGYRF